MVKPHHYVCLSTTEVLFNLVMCLQVKYVTASQCYSARQIRYGWASTYIEHTGRRSDMCEWVNECGREEKMEERGKTYTT